jgi:kynureninase
MTTHERMMSQMMDRMGADMRGMNMNGDAKWNALADSVKADLAELPGLRRGELVARMKAHTARVQRLIAMHEGMMKGM